MVDVADFAFWTPRFWAGHEGELTTLGLYTVGIAAYALVTFFFYRYTALRDMRLPDATARRDGFFWKVVGAVRYLFLFPAFSFAYFSVLVAALFVLSKNMAPEEVLLTSISLVAGVRATAYVSEEAAMELAKLVPLGLLGVLLVDPGYLSIETTVGRFLALPGLAATLLRYFLAFVALELALRVVYLVVPKGRKREEKVVHLVPDEPSARPLRAAARAKK